MWREVHDAKMLHEVKGQVRAGVLKTTASGDIDTQLMQAIKAG